MATDPSWGNQQRSTIKLLLSPGEKNTPSDGSFSHRNSSPRLWAGPPGCQDEQDPGSNQCQKSHLWPSWVSTQTGTLLLASRSLSRQTGAWSGGGGHCQYGKGFCRCQKAQAWAGRDWGMFWAFCSFPRGLVVKNPPANAGDVGSLPGSRRSSGGANGNPFQYPCLEHPKDRGAWQARVLEVEKDTS